MLKLANKAITNKFTKSFKIIQNYTTTSHSKTIGMPKIGILAPGFSQKGGDAACGGYYQNLSYSDSASQDLSVSELEEMLEFWGQLAVAVEGIESFEDVFGEGLHTEHDTWESLYSQEVEYDYVNFFNEVYDDVDADAKSFLENSYYTESDFDLFNSNFPITDLNCDDFFNKLCDDLNDSERFFLEADYSAYGYWNYCDGDRGFDSTEFNEYFDLCNSLGGFDSDGFEGVYGLSDGDDKYSLNFEPSDGYLDFGTAADYTDFFREGFSELDFNSDHVDFFNEITEDLNEHERSFLEVDYSDEDYWLLNGEFSEWAFNSDYVDFFNEITEDLNEHERSFLEVDYSDKDYGLLNGEFSEWDFNSDYIDFFNEITEDLNEHERSFLEVDSSDEDYWLLNGEFSEWDFNSDCIDFFNEITEDLNEHERSFLEVDYSDEDFELSNEGFSELDVNSDYIDFFNETFGEYDDQSFYDLELVEEPIEDLFHWQQEVFCNYSVDTNEQTIYEQFDDYPEYEYFEGTTFGGISDTYSDFIQSYEIFGEFQDSSLEEGVDFSKLWETCLANFSNRVTEFETGYFESAQNFDFFVTEEGNFQPVSYEILELEEFNLDCGEFFNTLDDVDEIEDLYGEFLGGSAKDFTNVNFGITDLFTEDLTESDIEYLDFFDNQPNTISDTELEHYVYHTSELDWGITDDFTFLPFDYEIEWSSDLYFDCFDFFSELVNDLTEAEHEYLASFDEEFPEVDFDFEGFFDGEFSEVDFSDFDFSNVEFSEVDFSDLDFFNELAEDISEGFYEYLDLFNEEFSEVDSSDFDFFNELVEDTTKGYYEYFDPLDGVVPEVDFSFLDFFNELAEDITEAEHEYMASFSENQTRVDSSDLDLFNELVEDITDADHEYMDFFSAEFPEFDLGDLDFFNGEFPEVDFDFDGFLNEELRKADLTLVGIFSGELSEVDFDFINFMDAVGGCSEVDLDDLDFFNDEFPEVDFSGFDFIDVVGWYSEVDFSGLDFFNDEFPEVDFDFINFMDAVGEYSEVDLNDLYFFNDEFPEISLEFEDFEEVDFECLDLESILTECHISGVFYEDIADTLEDFPDFEITDEFFEDLLEGYYDFEYLSDCFEWSDFGYGRMDTLAEIEEYYGAYDDYSDYDDFPTEDPSDVDFGDTNFTFASDIEDCFDEIRYLEEIYLEYSDFFNEINTDIQETGVDYSGYFDTLMNDLDEDTRSALEAYPTEGLYSVEMHKRDFSLMYGDPFEFLYPIDTTDLVEMGLELNSESIDNDTLQNYGGLDLLSGYDYSKAAEQYLEDVFGEFWDNAWDGFSKRADWDVLIMYEMFGIEVKTSDYIEAATWVFFNSGYVRPTILFITLLIITSKLMFLLQKLFTKSITKDLFFIVYMIACGCILGQCFMLITSCGDTVFNEEGILLLYVYTTAVLMLFLIFLALTTCESYMDKEAQKNNDGNPDLTNVVIGLIFLTCASAYYFSLMYTASTEYAIKNDVSHFTDADIGSVEVAEYIASGYTAPIESPYISSENVSQNYQVGESCVLREKAPVNEVVIDNDFGVEKHWSVFDLLKFDILDTHKEYIMSAVVQTVTLILVILSLII